MKLYRIMTTTGPRWFGTQIDAKAGAKQLGGGSFELVEVPTDKPNLLTFLNEYGQRDDEVEADPIAQAEQRALQLHGGSLIKYDYRSPFSAGTVLADIDASMCVKALRQFDGTNLGKVIAAAVERVSQLLGALPATGDNHGAG